jgi:peroxiredoxin
MVKTASTMLPLGTAAPDFELLNVDGQRVSLENFAEAPALAVMFICNHCPFVKFLAAAIQQLAVEYQARGAAFVAINANDASRHPEDSPERMVHEAEERGYTFPYLFDETQEVAKAYRAACTPDFYLFDKHRKLVYRGQFDDSRPSLSIPITGRDLRAALDAVLRQLPVPEPQRPSLGCNIKWMPGNEPVYFDPAGVQ